MKKILALFLTLGFLPALFGYQMDSLLKGSFSSDDDVFPSSVGSFPNGSVFVSEVLESDRTLAKREFERWDRLVDNSCSRVFEYISCVPAYLRFLKEFPETFKEAVRGRNRWLRRLLDTESPDLPVCQKIRSVLEGSLETKLEGYKYLFSLYEREVDPRLLEIHETYFRRVAYLVTKFSEKRTSFTKFTRQATLLEWVLLHELKENCVDERLSQELELAIELFPKTKASDIDEACLILLAGIIPSESELEDDVGEIFYCYITNLLEEGLEEELETDLARPVRVSHPVAQ